MNKPNVLLVNDDRSALIRNGIGALRDGPLCRWSQVFWKVSPVTINVAAVDFEHPLSLKMRRIARGNSHSPRKQCRRPAFCDTDVVAGTGHTLLITATKCIENPMRPLFRA
jgi:hypothetical protein